MSRRRRKQQRYRVRYWLAAAAVVLVACAIGAYTAANAIPSSNAGEDVTAIVPNDFAPADCAAFTVTAIVYAANGSAAFELVLGNGARNVMNGRGGRDCILGGAGNDALTGGAGNDVCIGGPGTDTFTTCEVQIQ